LPLQHLPGRRASGSLVPVKQTRELTLASQHQRAQKTPGLVLLFAAGSPCYAALALPPQGCVLGRGTPDGWLAADERVSRQHTRISRVAGCFSVEDAGSRNGTYVDGTLLRGPLTAEGALLLGLGHSLVWAVEDIAPFLDGERTGEDARGAVFGARMRGAMRELALAAEAGSNVFVCGPSGAGKELAAAAFHRFAHGERARAPFVAVNCATIPQGLAEGLLFGAKKGAYSGASQDTDGYFLSADGGTLFLDELAELDLAVQAKLLRVLETREVVPLGATQGKPVHLHVCAATLRDLRAEVEAGRFREDLYYRIGRPEVRLPTLQERIDELPFLIQRTVREAAPDLTLSHAFVESCALRAWPGNVRELFGEVKRACFLARKEGATALKVSHLSSQAGRAFQASRAPGAAASQATAPGPRNVKDDAEIARVLAEHHGNVTASAKALGIHRNQLRRWLERRDGGDGSE
jgi:transcriptional regulator of acetoin/glycerol metabolism